MADETDTTVSGILTVSAVVAGLIIGYWMTNKAGNYVLHSISTPAPRSYNAYVKVSRRR